MPDYSDLIGLPYRDFGRGPDAYDCYGLDIEVYRRNGKKLDDVNYENNRDLALSSVVAPLLNVQEIHEIEYLALLEFHILGELHTGVALNRRTFIHSTRNHGVKISEIKAYPLYKIYRVL